MQIFNTGKKDKPIQILKREIVRDRCDKNVSSGVNCLDNAKYWKMRRSNSYWCHEFSPPTSFVRAPWERLSVTLFLDSANMYPFISNDVKIEVFTISELDQFSRLVAGNHFNR